MLMSNIYTNKFIELPFTDIILSKYNKLISTFIKSTNKYNNNVVYSVQMANQSKH